MSTDNANAEVVHKVTLSSKKIVLLRDPLIKHTGIATQAAAPRANGDPHVLGMLAQQELLKLLVVQVDGKSPSRSDLENLDKMFTLKEFNQLQKVLQKLGGDEGNAEPEIEIVNFGGK